MFGSIRRSGVLAACRAAREGPRGARAPVAEAHARALAARVSSSSRAARASAAPIWTARPFSSAAEHAKPPAEIFGVVKVGAQQFKVVPDDLIVVEKLGEAKVNDPVVLSEVMMVGTAERPSSAGPPCPARRCTRWWRSTSGRRRSWRSKKRRKGYQRLKGHRQVRGASSPRVRVRDATLNGDEEPAALETSRNLFARPLDSPLSPPRLGARAGTHLSEDIADRRDGRPERMMRGEATRDSFRRHQSSS